MRENDEEKININNRRYYACYLHDDLYGLVFRNGF